MDFRDDPTPLLRKRIRELLTDGTGRCECGPQWPNNTHRDTASTYVGTEKDSPPCRTDTLSCFNEEKQLHYDARARINISELHHYLILQAKNQIQKRPIKTLS